MISTTAVVLKTDGEHAWVKMDRGVGCGQCDSARGKSAGCSAGTLGKLFCFRPKEFRVANTIAAQAGDSVTVAVNEGALAKSSGVAYLLPLLLLLAGAIAGSAWGGADGASTDLYAAAGAGVGLVLGLLGAKIYSSVNAGNRVFQPYIVG